ncbi:hypothetical protein OSTOST_05337, partial [Ostertagia ostertagi]
MCFVALRVTAFAVLLHLSQVTPGLCCTYTLLNVEGAYIREVVAYEYSSDLEGCFKKCYETSDCYLFVFDRMRTLCNFLVPGEGDFPLDIHDQPESLRVRSKRAHRELPHGEAVVAATHKPHRLNRATSVQCNC